MQPPFPSPVPTWHNDTYAAISPERPELSCAGKTVIITGAGSGIGRETAIAFAAAGAKNLVLVGRKIERLNETKSAVVQYGQTTCTAYSADVTDFESMAGVAGKVGTWDIFVLNSGYISDPSPIASSKIEDYWQNFETNVKAIVNVAKAFMPTASQTRPVLLGIGSGAAVFPAAMTAGLSGYITSKMACVKLLEYLSVENPHMFVASVHPGMVDTDIYRKGGGDPSALPTDTAKLPAHFMLWLCSPEAAELNGKFVWANWDVEELRAMADKIKSEDLMSFNVRGWPFSP